ncbi:cellulase family glycosylhydrolase [Microbacterium sp. ARD32]|uniref:glycoside hydrolase family 5 protein n=1 Tax=Microbacterium sp. ARD32 TaxID=2962577 RepID=UPI0028822FF6|nr:cellulase family glycosylhydrolase [Microbacterium sp. ARD32]MDT0157860.1 cellulase family glycosylhydrolase [Microbacterium sp. ARD32]
MKHNQSQSGDAVEDAVGAHRVRTEGGHAISADGSVLRDAFGRHRVFHGINLVAKGGQEPTGSYAERGFAGDWTRDDIADLARRGFSLIRLGVIWSAVEPRPGEYDEAYLDWISEQLDLIHAFGMVAVLDAHQDLYSQRFGDGAPDWATLTDQPYAATELWSDAYLSSPAVHEALDRFWANAAGPGGIGLQDRFAAMWSHVAQRLHRHPALIGYDLLNEPAPGSPAPQIFAALIGAFAQITGQDAEQVFADFADPAAKFAQLGRLDDERVHRGIGDLIHPLVARFEQDFVAPLMMRVSQAVREHDTLGMILREHDYFANLGIPSGQPPLDDANWAYSPHGYDLTVDTPAIALSSDTRAGTIFARHAETATRLGVPVIVGEWGALDLGEGVAGHARFLQDLFDAHGWSWTYWCWQPGFADSEAARALTRPRPLAFAGDAAQWRVDDGVLTASWRGADLEAPSVFFAPRGEATARRDGATVEVRRHGQWILLDAGSGDFEITVE